MHGMRFRHALALVVLAVLTFTACSQEPELVLSPAAAEGRTIANNSGCASCHGKNGQGVTAPSWQGIYGEQVELEDGLTVLVTDEYLYRSITDPQAQIVKDWTIKMPSNALTDDEVNAIIDYIKELS